MILFVGLNLVQSNVYVFFLDICGKFVFLGVLEWEWFLEYKCLKFYKLKERVNSLISSLVVFIMV